MAVWYDNSAFTAGASQNTCPSGTVLGSSFSTDSAGGALSSIPICLQNTNLDGVWQPVDISVDLYTDSGGPGPGSLLLHLASFLANQSGIGTTDQFPAYPNFTVFSFSALDLTPSTRYWVLLTAGSETNNGMYWYLANSDSGTGVSTEYGDFAGSVVANSLAPPAALLMGPIQGVASPTQLEISLFGTKRYLKSPEPECSPLPERPKFKRVF